MPVNLAIYTITIQNVKYSLDGITISNITKSKMGYLQTDMQTEL